MRRWVGRAGLLLIALALVLDLMLVTAGDPAALPEPLGALASEHVLPWAQDSVLPWAQVTGLVRPLEADVVVAAESAEVIPAATVEAAAPEAPAVATLSPTTVVPSRTPTPVGPAADATATPTTQPAKPPVASPASIVADSIGLNAPVVAVGVDKSGAMGTPRTSWQVGWYGPKPGEPGNALFAGHVDWTTQGKVVKGAFYSLSKLKAGDVIVVTGADGATSRFRVDWNRYYKVAAAPLEEIVGPTADPSITLITCGGPFDRNLKSYLGRWVVRATLFAN